MADPTRLLLLRHAESEWNARGLWQGWADPPLTDAGHRQAVEAGPGLQPWGFTAVVASNLQRASHTAALLASELDLSGSVEIDPDLREYDVGAWSGLSHAEIEDRWPGGLQAWSEGLLATTPDGEGREPFVARITAALARLGGAFGGERVLVVTHGGVIEAVERLLGVDRAAVPYLSGRWFEVLAGDIRLGSPPFAPGLRGPTGRQPDTTGQIGAPNHTPTAWRSYFRHP